MQPLGRQNIKVIIIDDTKSEKCEANCGADWSSDEALTLASQRIKDRFGGRVQLEYIDLSKPAGSHCDPGLTRRIKGLPLPLLVIDGEPRISGRFDIRMLLDVIEAETEMKQIGKGYDRGGRFDE